MQVPADVSDDVLCDILRFLSSRKFSERAKAMTGRWARVIEGNKRCLPLLEKEAELLGKLQMRSLCVVCSLEIQEAPSRSRFRAAIVVLRIGVLHRNSNNSKISVHTPFRSSDLAVAYTKPTDAEESEAVEAFLDQPSNNVKVKVYPPFAMHSSHRGDD